jgi:flagellar biosynthetic protein FliR
LIALQVSYLQIQLFLLVFLRVATMLMSMPIFSGNNVPNMFKAGLALAMTLLLYPLVDLTARPEMNGWLFLFVGIFSEVLLGLGIGLAIRFIMAGIQMAGQVCGYQMGLAIANIMDPATSMQTPILAQAYNLLAMLIFLAINAHHWFFRAMVDSFTIIPPFQFVLSASFIGYLMEMAGFMFVIALKIGAPIIVVLILTSVCFGLMARTVPQMNIFIVAMPLKIVVGLLFVIFSLPYLQPYLRTLFDGFGAGLLPLLKLMGS